MAALLRTPTNITAVQAIEFVQMQRDDELWELLISLAIGSADLTGEATSLIQKHTHVLHPCRAAYFVIRIPFQIPILIPKTLDS